MSDIQESSKENISELADRARIITIIVIILQNFKNWQQRQRSRVRETKVKKIQTDRVQTSKSGHSLILNYNLSVVVSEYRI